MRTQSDLLERLMGVRWGWVSRTGILLVGALALIFSMSQNPAIADDKTGSTSSSTEVGEKMLTGSGSAAQADPTWRSGLDRDARVHVRVQEGTPAAEGNFPFMAAIRGKDPFTDLDFYYCGGTAIADQWILTAAHCLVDRSDGAPFETSTGLWSHQRLGPIEIVMDIVDLTKTTQESVFSAKDIVLHEEYKPSSSSAGPVNDIALIRIDGTWPGEVARLSAGGPFDIDQAGQPIAQNCSATNRNFEGYLRNCLTTEGKERRVFVAGWGAQYYADGSNSPIKEFQYANKSNVFSAGSRFLRWTVMPSANVIQCRSEYGSIDVSGSLCAGFREKGPDACKGDSGGPLLALTSNDKLYQTGIVSYGRKCGETYGVYSRVSAHRTWLQHHVSGVKFVDVAPEDTRRTIGEMYASIEAVLTGAQEAPPAGGSDRSADGTTSDVAVRLLKWKDGKFSDPVDRVTIGEKVVFELELAAGSKARGNWLVVDLGSGDGVTQLYPNDFSSRKLRAVPGKALRIPGARSGFDLMVAPPAGEGQVVAIVVPYGVDLPKDLVPNAAKGFAVTQVAPVNFVANLLRAIQTDLANRGEQAEGEWSVGVFTYRIDP